MNAPDRYERFVVPEGVKKVTFERDTKIINAGSFTIEREDHTIGNIVRICTATKMFSLLATSCLTLSSIRSLLGFTQQASPRQCRPITKPSTILIRNLTT
ncbi:hypothetical protein Tsubulata_014504 [Turnera subulata]|uniref:DNA-directed RNA polymerase RBP11-like dimerisation domain-containing protein n=1 Tax=Turnera subulata TaxID=218843 RepID=A0A9Q0G456_9ROSI|nr:hypothetical protein Tsubulata_014504 [Turnera subulata]